ncbi:unnamed protein product [Lathyrus sativus]|nr:unnamed protein product [Lathyrus sativus]
MASTHKLFVLVALVIISFTSSTSIVESRKLSNASDLPSLDARLKVNGTEPSNCWESLFKLQACSGEIITFFINGETYLGNDCCKAIRVIGHDCWPKVVSSLGFTNLETYTLEGYCDDVENVHSHTSTLVEHEENIVP